MMSDSFFADAGWLFFAIWSVAVSIVSVTAFAPDLAPSKARSNSRNTSPARMMPPFNVFSESRNSAPAVLRIHRGEQEFNPFDAMNQLMAGKLSREDWVARCREFGISELILLPKPGASVQGADQQQAELFSVEGSKT